MGGTLPGWDVTAGLGLPVFLALFAAFCVAACWLERRRR
jgi:hypothetical protein